MKFKKGSEYLVKTLWQGLNHNYLIQCYKTLEGRLVGETKEGNGFDLYEEQFEVLNVRINNKTKTYECY